MLLHHARRAARTDADGSLVPLAEQDRGRWDTELIAEGVDVLQAALAARPARASTRRRPRSPRCTPTRSASEETDWVQIVEWYDELLRLTDTPVVRLNRAVAVGEADGAPAGSGRARRARPVAAPPRAPSPPTCTSSDGDLARSRPGSTPTPPGPPPTSPSATT